MAFIPDIPSSPTLHCRTHFETFTTALARWKDRTGLFGGDEPVFPPSEEFGYDCTPRNAVTFAQMGVDGVHYAVLKLAGMVRNQSPVVRISPMDDPAVCVLAESFLAYLAEGCGMSRSAMETVMEREREGKGGLLEVICAQFDGGQLMIEQRIDHLTKKYGHLIEPKGER